MIFPILSARPAKIQQVILNILRNGAQAMQEGGVGEPSFHISISRWAEREGVCIRICNNGPELDEETMRRVF